MDLLALMLTAGSVGLLCFTIYTANRAAVHGFGEDRLLQVLLSGLITFGAMFGIITGVSLVSPVGELTNADLTGALIYIGTTLPLSAAGWAFFRSVEIRQRFRTILPADTRFDPMSPVHTTAVILCLLLVTVTLGQFVAGGGLSGLAEDLQVAGVWFVDVLFNQVLWILAATLGVGLWLRRTPRRAAQRLGLRFPTAQDILWGMGIGILLVVALLGFTVIWISLVPPDQFAAQNAASSQLAAAFNTLPNALLLSLLVAVGEEAFFRGALQPIFGNVLTSTFFIVLHTQYTFSPATLPLFVTSLVLGWLRTRFSTSAAIVGHFTFNFTQLFLGIVAGG